MDDIGVKQRHLGEMGHVHILVFAIGEDLEEHEVAVIGETGSSEGCAGDGDALEGFNGVGVELLDD